MSILIFSKPIHSGKTTELKEWSALQKNIGGILMPDINGLRHMQNIRTGDIFVTQCIDQENTKEELETIGRFQFYARSFRKANEILLNEILLAPDWLIIDEVGRLEIEKGGFFPALQELIPRYSDTKMKGTLLVVIRETLLETVCGFFELKTPRVIHSLDDPLK